MPFDARLALICGVARVVQCGVPGGHYAMHVSRDTLCAVAVGPHLSAWRVLCLWTHA